MPRRRRPMLLAAIATAATVSIAHVWGGDDWTRYDHRTFPVTAALAGDVIRLRDGTPVRLLGVADPAPAATDWLGARLVGHDVTLLLPTAGVRDADGRLAAFAYADGQCVNVELVHAGLAYADRRTPGPLDGLTDPAESDARRHARGLWAGLRSDQQPSWRQAWLRDRAAGRR